MIRARLSGAGAWARENRWLLAAGLGAALPVILSTAHSLAVGWTPVGDDALIALRSYDVLSTHPPLLGPHSATSEVLGDASHHLGPMLYWVLAVPARLGSAAMVVTIGLVNSAALFGCVAIARRRGGTTLMIVAAVVLAAMAGSLVGRTYSDVWNPAAGVVPFTLLVFLAWTVGCGDYRLLPLTALVASFVVQCHLAYLPPTLGLMAVALTGLLVARRRARPAKASAPEAAAGERGSVRRSLGLAAVVLLVCWSGPLVDEAIHRPGNLEVVARTAFAGQATLGATAGWRAIDHAVGVPPWWTGTADSAAERFLEVGTDRSWPSTVSTVAILAALAGLLALALRRRRQDVAVASAAALVLVAAVGFVAANTPTKGLLGLSLAYTLWWGTTAGAWAWTTLACGAAALLLGRRVRLLDTRAGRAALAGAGALAVVVSLAAAGPGEDAIEPRYGPMRTLATRLDAHVPKDRVVLVAGSRSGGFDSRFDYEMGALYALRRAGATVVTDASDAAGGAYVPDEHRPELVLRVQLAGERIPPGARVVDRIAHEGGPTGAPALVITLAAAGGGS